MTLMMTTKIMVANIDWNMIAMLMMNMMRNIVMTMVMMMKMMAHIDLNEMITITYKLYKL